MATGPGILGDAVNYRHVEEQDGCPLDVEARFVHDGYLREEDRHILWCEGCGHEVIENV